MTLVPLTRRRTPVVAEPLTRPLPRLTDVVHAVTATFASGGWTLRFGPSGQQVVVDRLAEADAAARRLVGAVGGPGDESGQRRGRAHVEDLLADIGVRTAAGWPRWPRRHTPGESSPAPAGGGATAHGM